MAEIRNGINTLGGKRGLTNSNNKQHAKPVSQEREERERRERREERERRERGERGEHWQLCSMCTKGENQGACSVWTALKYMGPVLLEVLEYFSLGL